MFFWIKTTKIVQVRSQKEDRKEQGTANDGDKRGKC